jgi:hypothetical protein
MDTKHTMNEVIELLWELLHDADTTQQFINDPSATVASLGMPGVSCAEIQDAMPYVADRLPQYLTSQLPAVRAAAVNLPGDTMGTPVEPVSAPTPMPEPAPVRQATRPQNGNDSGHTPRHEAAPSHAEPANLPAAPSIPLEPAIVNHIINNTYVTNDNRVITEIQAGDDVNFDQDIENHNVTATNGGVAVEGDVDDSVVNTGTNSGVIAGDDADLDDSIVGNGNTQVNDSDVGALATDGDAQNIEAGGDVNTGSGDLIDVDAAGDAQVVTGHGNEVSGDVDVDASDVDGPVNVAVGDGNGQAALQDQSTTIEDSMNTDNSIEDSGNTLVEDSGNLSAEDNDSAATSVDDSFNASAQDNDQAIYEETYAHEDNSSYSDDDSQALSYDHDTIDVDTMGDDNDLDLDS